ncbi:MAG: hypothetical protein KKE86_08325 [Planctomycetes bacterium]|nr:hypothetical protein [Planctomycetota bacterium]
MERQSPLIGAMRRLSYQLSAISRQTEASTAAPADCQKPTADRYLP